MKKITSIFATALFVASLALFSCNSEPKEEADKKDYVNTNEEEEDSKIQELESELDSIMIKQNDSTNTEEDTLKLG